MVPSTLLGKILASWSCIAGIMLISMPVPIIVNNFVRVYKEAKKRKDLLLLMETDPTTRQYLGQKRGTFDQK